MNSTGDRNTGDWNTGHRNIGHRNTGNWNTGNCNTGDRNTGYCNSGDRNTGNYNTGDRNTGDWNTGNYNTGYWNTGNYNTGYCNSVTPKTCLIFNKEAKQEDWANAEKPNWMYCNLTNWIGEDNMTEKEKEAYPSYATTGGYLKSFNSLKSAYIDSWGKATDEDKALTRELPNFNEDVFAEVFGFNPWKKVEKKKMTVAEICKALGEDIEIVK